MDIEAKKKQIKNKLTESRENLLKAIKYLKNTNLTKKVSSQQEAWSVLEVVCHLDISERGMTTLIQQIQNNQEGVPADFDLNRYNKRSVSKISNKSLNELLSEMQTNRENLFKVIDDLKEEDWGKKGRHGSLRILSIEEILNTISDHEHDHLEKIKTVL